jgi:hypothetical protein
MTQIQFQPVERWTASCCALYKRVRRSFTIAGSRGKKRAAIAVAHTMLVIIYALLKEGTTYQEIAGESEAA